MLRYSANARDVHLLRALGSTVVADAREAHDRGIKVAMAALCAQIEIPPADKVAFLYQVEDAEIPTQFLKAYPRMQLHEFAGGLRLRPWKEYGDPAFTATNWRHHQLAPAPPPNWRHHPTPIGATGGPMAPFVAVSALNVQRPYGRGEPRRQPRTASTNRCRRP